MQLKGRMKPFNGLRSRVYTNLREYVRNITLNPMLRPAAEALLKRLVLLTPKQAFVEDSQMFLAKDRICLQMALSGTWEPRNTMLVRSEVKKGDVVVDIGAHVGYYTLIFSKLVGDSGRVYSFEPDAGNFALLKANIEANGCRNVVLERKAVSEESGVAFFGDWSLKTKVEVSGNHLGGGLASVEVVALDDYFGNEATDIAFLKIDIEGNELRALRGAADTIRRSGSMRILTEFDPFRWSKTGVNPRELLDFLADNGFVVSIVSPKQLDLEPVEDFDDMLSRYNQMGVCLDLFCVQRSAK